MIFKTQPDAFGQGMCAMSNWLVEPKQDILWLGISWPGSKTKL
jgi:hypothetical protein